MPMLGGRRKHADKRRTTTEVASADKEASQNQSDIPNR